MTIPGHTMQTQFMTNTTQYITYKTIPFKHETSQYQIRAFNTIPGKATQHRIIQAKTIHDKTRQDKP
jgi:hypothetical protein